MRGVTITIMLLVAIGLSAFDVYLAFNHVKGDTISAIIYETSLQTFLLPYTFGILMGHFFWPSSNALQESWAKGTCLAMAAASFLLIDIYMLLGRNKSSKMYAILRRCTIVVFAIGVFLGHWIWAQPLL